MKHPDEYNVHLLDHVTKRYGEIINTFRSMDDAIAFANKRKEQLRNDYAVVRGSLVTVYSTVAA